MIFFLENSRQAKEINFFFSKTSRHFKIKK